MTTETAQRQTHKTQSGPHPMPTDRDAIQAMHRDGGGFIRKLAAAYEAADPKNQRRLLSAFAPEFARYGRIWAGYASPQPRRLRMDKAMIEAVKREMGYSDGTDCCKACQHFVEADRSGSHNALPAHCRRNAFIVPVSEAGRCRHWTAKA